jgi:hypothetical protein
MSTAAPKVGQTYTVRHTRKGTFKAKVLRVDEEFAQLLITEGYAGAIINNNERYVGDKLDVRLSFCKFTPTT